MDQDLTEALTALLKPGQTFFDIGAHLGYFALLARHLVGETGLVVAFEPTPASFALLRRNARHYPNLQVYPLALWSEKSLLAFNLYGQRFSAYNSFFAPRILPAYQRRLRRQVVEIETISLDEFVRTSGVVPDVIKVDAESAELHIVKGAAHVLRTYRPVVILEVGDLDVPGAATSAQLVAFLHDEHGYAPCEWREGQLVPHQIRERYNAGNMIFVPRPVSE